MRDAVVFYKSFFESIGELSPENALNIYNAIFRYAFYDEDPELSGVERAIFTIIKPQIDANNRRYENGKKGGRPSKNTENTKDENKNHRFNNSKTSGFNDKKPKEKENDKDKEKDKGNVNENENEKNIYGAKPEEEKVISLTLNDNTSFDILQSDIDGWKELYQSVDILQELKKMKGWLDSNPTKRKTKRGIKKFINGWLAREQDKGGVNRGSSKDSSQESGSSARLW